MNYSQVYSELVKLAVTTETDQRFLALMPRITESAEQRIYRDLDLLTTVIRDDSLTFTAGSRTLNLPASPHFVTLQEVNVVTPAAQTDPDLGTRNPLLPVSKVWLDYTYGSATGSGRPQYFAMLTDQTILVGPWPDAAYTVELVGTWRPAPLTSANSETWLTQYLPDVFIAACMIFIAGAQRDYGAQADDPKLAVSWERQYQTLLTSSATEEARKKFMAR